LVEFRTLGIMRDLTEGRYSLKGKRIFLTGGTGLFGKWLLTALQDSGAELVLLTRNPEAFCQAFPLVKTLRIEFVQGDIRDFKFPEGHFDYCIHAATPVVSDDLSDADAVMTTIIVEGTKRVLDFARLANVGRLLYISSGAVYGVKPPELERIPESFPCNPVSVYGKGKLRAEGLCLESGLDCVIARCFAFVGPHMPLDAHFAIGNFIGNCLRNESIVIKGDGTAMRSYMYSSDLVEWLIVMLVRGKTGEIYNVGSDVPISIADLAQKVRDLSLAKNQIEISLTADQSKAVERYIPCVKKASRALSLKLKVDLDHSILNTLKMTCC
jgi:nucleoside-diphosphate-sugar epimerase